MSNKELCDGYGRKHFANGRYFNPWSDEARSLGFNFNKNFYGLLKFMTMSRAIDVITPNSTNQDVLDNCFPVATSNLDKCELPEKGIKCTWLGHATCLVQFDRISVLTDPALSPRCAPVQAWGLPKRLRKIPCPVEELPPIDIVVVSHNHYDHLDYNTVKILNERQGSRIHWFVGLGLEKWFKDMGCENVKEMDWWDEHELPNKVKVIFTPTQHWSKRTAFDTNKTLWGSWIVKGPNHSFMHVGDTGYCQTFKTIGDVHGPFDLAAVPIGAYHPRGFLRPQHVNPEEAVQIHQDIRAKKSIAIHWGTFQLGKEPFLEPPKLLKESLKDKGVDENDFFTSKIGEVLHLFS